MIFIYRFCTVFFYPFLIFFIYFRKLINKEDKKRYKEKIFTSHFFPTRNREKKLIWFHAASIGEVQSIFPLLFRLDKERKDLEFLITTVTLSSGNLIEKKINTHSNIMHRYFPLDVNFLVKKFIQSWNPSLVMFVDSEVWPNFIFEIKNRNIPTGIVNGRITKKTFKRWVLISRFAKEVFSSFDLCLSSSKESKKHLESLGVQNSKYIGNIKFTSTNDEKNISLQDKEMLNKKKIWCAASTHEGEEIFCLKAHMHCKQIIKDIVTIIIPRHINRSRKIKKLCIKLGLSVQILNDKELIQDEKEIIIINTFGELLKYFKYCKSVFIGKSLIKKLQHVGGQNPIEAAKLNCKIYHGPFVYNFKEIYDLLKSYNISYEINDEKELSDKLLIDFQKQQEKLSKNSDVIHNLGNNILENSVKEIAGILK